MTKPGFLRTARQDEWNVAPSGENSLSALCAVKTWQDTAAVIMWLHKTTSHSSLHYTSLCDGAGAWLRPLFILYDTLVDVHPLILMT